MLVFGETWMDALLVLSEANSFFLNYASKWQSGKEVHMGDVVVALRRWREYRPNTPYGAYRLMMGVGESESKLVGMGLDNSEDLNAICSYEESNNPAIEPNVVRKSPPIVPAAMMGGLPVAKLLVGMGQGLHPLSLSQWAWPFDSVRFGLMLWKSRADRAFREMSYTTLQNLCGGFFSPSRAL